MVIFLFMINFIGALVVSLAKSRSNTHEAQAVQLLRGDIITGNTITFSQTYNSFLGMYQVRRLSVSLEPHKRLTRMQIFSSENWTTILYSAVSPTIARTPLTGRLQRRRSGRKLGLQLFFYADGFSSPIVNLPLEIRATLTAMKSSCFKCSLRS